MLRVWLSGRLRIAVGEHELELPASRRARALLAWLALHPGAHARGDLAARFWPDVLDESARASLRGALAELRRALGGGAPALRATRETVSLSDDAWIDVREFDRRLAQGDPAAAIAACGSELLTGMDDDWVHEARATHRAALADARETLARRAEQDGDTPAAVSHSRAIVALDPLAEEPARRLIRRLLAAGDRGAAIAAYEQLAERMRTELGLAPSAQTRALLDELRATRLDVPAPAALAAGPFIGRRQELRRLSDIWERTVGRGTRKLVLIAGEPGIGKTRLALRFAEKARRDGAVVLLGRCSSEPIGAYEPFAEVLDQCAAAVGRETLLAAAGRGSDELARLLADGAPDAGGDPSARHRLFRAIDAALSAFSPLVLIVDDAQWADKATLSLLRALLRPPWRSPVLVIATSRATELPLARVLVELQRDDALERVELHGLAPEEVRELAAAVTDRDDARRVAETIHARTGGNPFFAEALLRAPADGDAPPASVREAILVRRARLSQAADAMLEAAAVMGSQLDPAALGTVAGLSGAAAEPALDELLAARLLSPAEPGVEFAHALIREAVEAELNELRRRRLHRRAADVLIEDEDPRRLERIAHHLLAAGDRDRAVDYLARAGARAAGLYAYEEAAAGFASALAQLRDDDPRAGELQLARGDALLRAGEAGGARESFAAAAAIARRAGDTELLARAALGRAGLAVTIAAIDTERLGLLEEAIAATRRRHPALAAQLLSRLAVELYYTPARDRSDALSEEAVALASATEVPGAVASALNARHVALWRPDRLDERLEIADRMLASARAAGDRGLELQACNWRVVDLFERGDLGAWREAVRRHGALADELRLPLYQWYTPLWAAVDALHAGRFAEAAAVRDEALELGAAAGDDNAPLFAQLLGIHETWLRDDFAAVDLDLIADRVARSPAGSAWRCGYTWCLAELGRESEAREHLREIASDGYASLPFDTNWPSAAGECAEACALLGAAEHAAPLYTLLAPYAGRPLTAGRALLSYGAVDRHLGGLAAVLGRPEDAIAHYERAIAIDAAAGLRPWVVRSRRALARVLRDCGETRRAAETEAIAAAGATELAI